jgi:cyanophycin synthetase
MEILETQIYRGANLWAPMPAIRLLVDIGELEERPTNAIPGFYDKLTTTLPGMVEHFCSVGRRGGFFERVREGTWMGHVLEHTALELQSLAGQRVGYGKARSARDERGAVRRGIYQVVYEYEQEDVGIAAGHLAKRLLESWIWPERDPDFAYQAGLEDLIRLAERKGYGPSTRALVEEAQRRDIPVQRLDEDRSLVQLGHGMYQQRLWASVTSKGSDIAVDIAADKELTSRLLRNVGIPVPEARTVEDAAGAVRAAGRIGYPVVVKPLDGNHGRGVGINLADEAAVRAHFPIALRESRAGTVVVESYIVGKDYRILVVGGRVVAVAERVPAHVVGDGQHTLQELVAITNADPRRGVGHEKVLTRLTLDAAALALAARQGYGPGDVPPAGTHVQLALTGNMSTGGTAIDRTDEIHPENYALASQAALVIGLDVAGIDFIAPDIAQSVREAGGAICEVNAGPGFRMHTHPTEGIPRDVARPVIDLLFPPGSPARVPIVAVTGTNGKTTTCRMIAHILKMAGRKVGFTTTDGIYIDGTQIAAGDMSGPQSARMVLQNPAIDAAVLETARGGMLRSGLGYDRANVAVVTNVAPDHLGLRGIHTLEDLARVKAIVAGSTDRDGTTVLNADNEHTARMSRDANGRVIYFSMAAGGPDGSEVIERHLRRDGVALFLRDTPQGETMTLHDRREIGLVRVSDIPATFGSRARMNVANALAAAAACIGLGIDLACIRQGLRTFTTTYFQVPGRLNLIETRRGRVLMDYCHNAAGMAALADFVGHLSPGHTIAMLNVPGDRREEDFAEFGSIAARAFDRFIVTESADTRGRPRGAGADLLRQALLANGARPEHIAIETDEDAAIRLTLDRMEPNELAVLLVDKPAEAWSIVSAAAGVFLANQPTAATV